MTEHDTKAIVITKSKTPWVFLALVAIGVATFVFGLTSQHPEKAWQAYLINFLLWSAIAQGAVLFSAVMHMTNARWSVRFPDYRNRLPRFFRSLIFYFWFCSWEEPTFFRGCMKICTARKSGSIFHFCSPGIVSAC